MLADSIFDETSSKVFSSTTAGKQWISEDLVLNENRKIFYVNPLMTQTQLQTVFNLASAESKSQVTFMGGSYTFNDSIYIDGTSDIIIEGNNSTVTLDTSYFIITTNASYKTFSDFDFTMTEAMFDGEILKDSSWVLINDSTDFAPLSRGDALVLADSTEDIYFSNQQFYRGDILYFDRFSVDGAQQKMHFEKPSLVAINVNSDLYEDLQKANLAEKRVTVRNLQLYNTRLQFSGFENVLIDNVHIVGPFTETTAPGGLPIDTIRRGFSTHQCRFVSLINSSAVDWALTAEGYGLMAYAFDKLYVNNCFFRNCRHAITTISYGHALSHDAYVGNSTAISTIPKDEFNVSLFDTHPQTYSMVYENCIARGGYSSFNDRSKNVTLINCEAYDTYRGLRVAITKDSTRNNVIVDGFKVRNTTSVIKFANNINTKFVSLSGLEVDNTDLIINIGTDSFTVDKFEIKDSRINFGGTGTVMTSGLTPKSPVEYLITELELDNVKLDSMSQLIVNPSVNIRNLKAKNCEFNLANDWFIQHTATDTAATDAYVSFVNCDFYNINRSAGAHIGAATGIIRYNKFIFDRNTIHSGKSILDFKRIYIDTVIITNNNYTSEFERGFVFFDDPYVAREIYIQDNNLFGLPGISSKFIDASDSTLTGKARYHINGNKMNTETSEVAHLFYNDFYVIDNIFNFSHVDAVSNTMLLEFKYGATGFVFDNRFIINVDSGVTDCIRIRSAEDTLIIDNNTFIQTSSTASQAIDQDAGLLTIGRNSTYGFSAPSFAGDQDWLDMILSINVIDTVVVDADTINWVK